MLLLVFYHNEQDNNLNCDAIFSCDIRQLDMLVSACGILFAKKIWYYSKDNKSSGMWMAMDNLEKS